MTLERAVEAFVGGFCYTRSFTYPYEAVRLGPLWIMRDSPPRKDQRVSEVVAPAVSPSVALEWLQRDPPYRPFLCAIDPVSTPDAKVVHHYKAANYRFLRHEPLMARSLAQEVEWVDCDYRIVRLSPDGDLDGIAKQIKMRLARREDLTGGRIRSYIATDGDLVVGYVRAIVVERDTWVSSMFVSHEYRRRGIGRAILSRMLDDDRHAGVENSVLLASSSGAKLYPWAGYETIGMLRSFMPRRAS